MSSKTPKKTKPKWLEPGTKVAWNRAWGEARRYDFGIIRKRLGNKSYMVDKVPVIITEFPTKKGFTWERPIEPVWDWESDTRCADIDSKEIEQVKVQRNRVEVFMEEQPYVDITI